MVLAARVPVAASYWAWVTSVLPSQKPCESVTGSWGPSALLRLGSSGGLPMRNVPGLTQISSRLSAARRRVSTELRSSPAESVAAAKTPTQNREKLNAGSDRGQRGADWGGVRGTGKVGRWAGGRGWPCRKSDRSGCGELRGVWRKWSVFCSRVSTAPKNFRPGLEKIARATSLPAC